MIAVIIKNNFISQAILPTFEIIDFDESLGKTPVSQPLFRNDKRRHPYDALAEHPRAFREHYTVVPRLAPQEQRFVPRMILRIRTLLKAFNCVRWERRQLLELSDYQLRDIGLNRCDVYQITRLPLWRRVQELANHPDLWLFC